MALYEELVPRSITEAVPWIDLHLPVLGFMSATLPMMLADLLPTVYSFEEDSHAMTSSMIATLQMSSKALIMGAVIPFVIDGAGLSLWIVAVIAWWRHTYVMRSGYAVGGDMTGTDLAVTLVLAAAPGLLAVFDIGLAFVP